MKIAWNAIVKNEEAVIERCLKSLLPHIDCGIVVDTGSTDYTVGKIKRLFMEADKPVEVHSVPFENFAQARNAALRLARASPLDYSYLLLADADMELVVEKVPWLNGESGLSYDMEQRAGALVYSNRRLVKREATGEYLGVTHEYLDIPSAGAIDGAWFRDHADGANRPDKLARDVALLEAALDKETSLGLIQRYHFYLANCYFELGEFGLAIVHYKRRTEMGGYDEEVWYAQMRLANCYERLGQHAHFLWEMLRAYSMRPRRSETLYELARFFRERGENFASLLYSDPGRGLPVPGDALFVNDWVYKAGLKEEFSICAYYSERHRRSGKEICNQLALAGSEQARDNMYWYLQPLGVSVPSFKPMKINFTPPEGWAAMNPSVINRHGKPMILVRTVNYEITPEGRYVIRGAPDAPVVIRTRNWLVRADFDGSVESVVPLHLPEDLPAARFPLVLGFEDSRLFEWNGSLWTISTVRELSSEGWCEQVLAPLNFSDDGFGYRGAWTRIEVGEKRHEKNWMPWPRDNNALHFVYRLGCVIDDRGDLVYNHDNKLKLGNVSGGSQVIEVAPKLYMAIVHEARNIPGRVNRYYQHRFVLLQENGSVMGISEPFFFHDRQIEFAAGLAKFGRQLMVSYGVRDEEAWIATMDLDEVMRFIA